LIHRILIHETPVAYLRATHAAAAVVAEVAIAVSHRNGAAIVARRGIGLERGELFAA
jgi:hypothetical protein